MTARVPRPARKALAAAALMLGLLGCDAGAARAQGGAAATRPGAAAAASDSATARLERAVGRYRRGEHEEAMREFAAITRSYGQREGAGTAELMAVAEAYRYLGRRDPARFRDALAVRRDQLGKVSLNGKDMLVAEMLAWVGRLMPVADRGGAQIAL